MSTDRRLPCHTTDGHRKTIGADKNDDTKEFVAEMRRIGVTPHVAQNTARSGGSAIDRRTTRHQGYAQSINARRGIEKVIAGSSSGAGCVSSGCAAPKRWVSCLDSP
jgi:hypothetical protein